MEPNETTEPIYNWRYEHGVDEKRRLQIPADWRPAEGSLALTLILWRKYPEGPCVRLLPPKQVEKLKLDLEALPPDERGVVKRAINSDSIKVLIDKSGRIILPEEMAQEAGIKDRVALVGLGDRFELWEPQRYKSRKGADEPVMQAAMKKLE